MNTQNQKTVVTLVLVGLITFTFATLDARVASSTALIVFTSSSFLAFSRFGWKGCMGVLLLSVVISDSTYGGSAVIGALGSVSAIGIASMLRLCSRIATSTEDTSVTGEAIYKTGSYKVDGWAPDNAVLCVSGSPMSYQTGHEIAVDVGGEVSFFD